MLDIFDGNAYAKDTRKDFINWSIWAPGAFDYSADKVGLTYGATAELNQKQWALRSGYFLMQSVSNANSFDTNVFERGGYVARARNALLAVLAARQAAHHRLAQQCLFRQLSRNARQPGAQSRHLADPHGPHQIRLRRQPRAGADRRYRHVRALELERRQERDHGLHRHRRQPLVRRLDQGHRWGRPDDAIGFGGAINALSQRPSRLHRRRRPRHPDRRRRAQLPARAILETYYAFASTD